MLRWQALTGQALAATAIACALLAIAFASAARAEETVSITAAGFSPDALDSATNASGRAVIDSSLPVPSPITHVNVLGPAGVTLNLQGTGICNKAALENLGTQACPADSRAGFGGGEGVYEIAKEIVQENFTLDFFLSDNKPGHVQMLVYLNGSTPVSIQLVFTATIIQAPKPYGLGFSLNVPLIKVLPEASDASARSSYVTLGARNVAYYKRVKGKRKLFHVQGIVTPKTCPRGGWPVATQFSFEDGSTVMAKRKIPCPRR